VAGVKAQKGGKSVPPKWTNRPCIKCALAIEKQADAYRVQSFEFIGFRKSTEWHWVHRKCLDTK
jgi:hypothetical protein